MTYANVAATIAVFFALSGGAYAAGKYLITSTKQIKPSVLASLKGKSGANGAPGAQGPAGATGAKGETGAGGSNGEKGQTGATGPEGAAGTSVESKTINAGASNAHCPEGGSEFTGAESRKTYACNGSPWTAGGTLPAGKTEKGTWSFTSGETQYAGFVPISFPIPLSAGFTVGHIHFLKSGEKQAHEGEGCYESGSVATPMAEPGNLCIYVTSLNGVSNGNTNPPVKEEVAEFENPEKGSEPETVGTTGISLDFFTAYAEAEGSGDWAVTEKTG